MIIAHKIVAEVAEAMAQEVYEELAKSNRFYAANKDRNAFIRECAPSLREKARKYLAGTLQDNRLSEDDKYAILEGIMLDQTIPANAKPGFNKIH